MNPEDKPRNKPGRKRKVTRQVMEAVAELVAVGMTEAAAARQCGLKESTLRSSHRRDTQFRELIEVARVKREALFISTINRAALEGLDGKPPDWRASAWLLEHLPCYRDRYGKPTGNPVVGGLLPDQFSRRP